jgi:hypothetical protein
MHSASKFAPVRQMIFFLVEVCKHGARKQEVDGCRECLHWVL